MYNYKNKANNVYNLKQEYLNRTTQLFKYDGLPETMNKNLLESRLQQKGYLTFCKYNEELVFVDGTLSGQEHNIYNEPTEVIIANKFINKTLAIDKECIVMKNDSLMLGLLPILEKYCFLINEADLSTVIMTYNKRIQFLISATDDDTIESSKQFLDKAIDGELGVVADSKIFDNLKVSPTSPNTSNKLTDIIELQQYLRATLFNELGVNANNNMKRERLTDDEVQVNDSTLQPLVDNMLEERKEAIEKINDLFGTNIKVDFASVWKNDDEQRQPEPEPEPEPVSEPEPVPEPETTQPKKMKKRLKKKLLKKEVDKVESE